MVSRPAATPAMKSAPVVAARELRRGQRRRHHRHARMQHRRIVGVVVVAGVGHHPVHPGRVVRRDAVAEREDRRLPLATPFDRQLARLGHAGGTGAGGGAGEGIEDIDLGGGEDRAGEFRGREAPGETGEDGGKIVGLPAMYHACLTALSSQCCLRF